MFNCNALLLKDFYKAIHCDLIPKNMTKSVSYFTPRMSRVTASRNPKKDAAEFIMKMEKLSLLIISIGLNQCKELLCSRFSRTEKWLRRNLLTKLGKDLIMINFNCYG